MNISLTYFLLTVKRDSFVLALFAAPEGHSLTTYMWTYVLVITCISSQNMFLRLSFILLSILSLEQILSPPKAFSRYDSAIRSSQRNSVYSFQFRYVGHKSVIFVAIKRNGRITQPAILD